jgi:alanine racemase
MACAAEEAPKLEYVKRCADIASGFRVPEECMPVTDLRFPIHPTRATIDLPAFRNNLSLVRSYVGNRVRIMAVVKANAYGHGMLRIAREAVQNGASYLGVARVEEGIELKKEGIDQAVLVFEVPPGTHLEKAIAEGLELTVTSVNGARAIAGVAQKARRKARIQVKVDTGMGRLGVHDQGAIGAVEQIARLPEIELAGVYSHFATSDEEDQSFALAQLTRFERVLEGLQHRRLDVPLRHMANSGAIISLPSSYFDMVRPGIMLYGYLPRKGMPVARPLVPVMSLLSVAAFIKTVAKGTSISYGRRYYAPEETRIATVPVGYADGYSRLLTNNSEVLIRGTRFPVVGTICMDHFMVDLGERKDVEEGDLVTLVGSDGAEQITAWDLAEKLQTIPYEVTCMISARVPRHYRE